MLVSELLEQMTELSVKIGNISSSYFSSESEYGAEISAFSQSWFWDNANFKVPLDGIEEPVHITQIIYGKIPAHQLVVDTSSTIYEDFVTKYCKNISDEIDLVQLQEDYEMFSNLYDELQNLITEHDLDSILDINIDVFLGFDSVYYESSKCW